jgi:hypothetical protein
VGKGVSFLRAELVLDLVAPKLEGAWEGCDTAEGPQKEEGQENEDL